MQRTRTSHLFTFCDHHHSLKGNLTFNGIKYDTARFRCVCDRFVVVCCFAMPKIR